MERIIKFKRWDKTLKEMSEPETLEEIIAEDWYDYPVERFVQLQFTGLVDKNGKEIYEGDILDVKEDTGMQNGTFMNYLHEVAWDERGGWNLISPWNESEVIGNIYENKELLA